MKIALEGAINKCSDAECRDWREQVITELGQLYTFHNPMDFDCRGKEAELEAELIKYDTAGLASSDIILVMALKPSWGTAMAIQMTWADHKAIIAVNADERPSPWLKNRCSLIVPTLEVAIKRLKALAVCAH